jgi:hypothetical protein
MGPDEFNMVAFRQGTLTADAKLWIKIKQTKLLISLVAGERYRFSPHDANLRYFLRSSA